ncbi:uncharacterized protein LOC129568305 [Sitodiplosis mosellana]|uniref:uncharacterized protein LOC129568305 n=1 Tax=Sitodiplosis mosellana TaxID=263140 RepID=UPI0024440111|nr:uncharacterized protein LOC129568305 [Sitodiplosis mosellana]
MLNKLSVVFAVCVMLCVGYSNADVSVGECVSCDSNSDPNCAINPGTIEPQKCSNLADSCYSRIVNEITYRGCFKDLDEGIQKRCLNDTSPDQQCNVCENVNNNKGCNNEPFPRSRLTCHSCSGDLKSTCFQAPVGNAQPCQLYRKEDKCYIRKTGKTIERGCLSDTAKCSNPSHCSICDGEGCNNELGNSTSIPTAPNVGTQLWAPTVTMMLIAVLVNLKVSS